MEKTKTAKTTKIEAKAKIEIQEIRKTDENRKTLYRKATWLGMLQNVKPIKDAKYCLFLHNSAFSRIDKATKAWTKEDIEKKNIEKATISWTICPYTIIDAFNGNVEMAFKEIDKIDKKQENSNKEDKDSRIANHTILYYSEAGYTALKKAIAFSEYTPIYTILAD